VTEIETSFLLHLNSSVAGLGSGKKDMEQLKTYSSSWLLVWFLLVCTGFFVCVFFVSKHRIALESAFFFF